MAKRDLNTTTTTTQIHNIKVKKADSVRLDGVCDDGGGQSHRPQHR